MQRVKKYIILIIMIIIIGISSNVFAFELIPDLEIQDLESRKITILLNMSDLSEYEDGINVASGKLKYDNSIFEDVTFSGTNGWTVAYNDNKSSDSFGKFMLVITSGNIKKEQEVAQINLKVKADVKNVRTKIKFESLETSYKSETIKGEDKELKIDITKDEIKLTEENLKNVENTSENVENNEKVNYTIYVIIIFTVIILIMLLIFIIKFKRKGGKNND